MRRRTVLAGGVTIGLAGCLQLEEELEGGDGETGGRDETGPPADDADEFTFPTGIDEDGVSAVLVDTFRNALMDVGGTTEVRRDELTHEHDRYSFRSHIDGRTALTDIDRSGERVEMYMAPADGGYWRGRVAGEQSYGRIRPAKRSDMGWAIQSRELRPTIRAADWNEPTVDEENRRFLIEAEGVDDETQLAERVDAESIESLTAEGVVDADGVIRELEVEYEFLHRERVLVNTMTVTTENLGEPPETEPEWLDEAIAEAPDIEATAIKNRSYIELVHGGGNPIPTDTAFVLHGDEQLGSVQPTEPVEAGDVLYLYVENGDAHASRGSPPSDASPDSLPRVAIWGIRVSEYFFLQV